MRRPRRWRWWGKWAGTVLCVVIAAAWVVSGWWNAGITWQSAPARMTTLTVGAGTVRWELFDGARIVTPWGRVIERLRSPQAWRWGVTYHHDSDAAGRVSFVILWFPLWAPFVPSAVCAACLWRLDRKCKPGQCPRCHYDLTGSPPGPCPECGGAAASAS